MLFHYSAIDAEGRDLQGDLTADSRAAALAQLARKGLQVRQLQPLATSTTTASPAARPSHASPGDPSPASPVRLSCGQRQVEGFTSALADLLSAGMPLEASLGAIARRSRDPKLATLASLLQSKVQDGVPLSRAIADTTPAFGPLYTELLKAGEQVGALPDILRRQSAHLTTIARLRRDTATALIYPATLLVAGAAVAALFLFFLLPRLVILLESAGGGLPAPVAAVLAVRSFTFNHWPLLLAAALLAALAITLALRHPAWQHARHRLALQIPAVGRVLKTRFAVSYLEALATLLQGGVRVEQALALVARAASNLHLQLLMGQVREKVADGRPLATALDQSKVFPDIAIDLIQVGESAGRLAPGVARAAARLDEELAEELKRASALAGPAVITVMAVLVGGMAYLITSSVFDTISALRSGR
jgi:type II secretory pathway component PulF